MRYLQRAGPARAAQQPEPYGLCNRLLHKSSQNIDHTRTKGAKKPAKPPIFPSGKPVRRSGRSRGLGTRAVPAPARRKNFRHRTSRKKPRRELDSVVTSWRSKLLVVSFRCLREPDISGADSVFWAILFVVTRLRPAGGRGSRLGTGLSGRAPAGVRRAPCASGAARCRPYGVGAERGSHGIPGQGAEVRRLRGGFYLHGRRAAVLPR